MKKNKVKILFIDIENLAHLIWAWDTYDTNAIEIERPGHLISMAYKWQGGKTQVIAQCDYKGYKPGSDDDKKLCEDIWKLLDEADIIIGHNAQDFDIKKINYRFMVNGLPPTSPYKIVDTLKSLRKVAKAPSARLDAVGKDMKLGRKLENEGWTLWKKCYLGDKDSWTKMKKYNKQDVDLLEKWYNKLLPWISGHPNLALMNGDKVACPNCGSLHIQMRGFNVSRTTKSRRFQCQDCGSWSSALMNSDSQVR